MKLWLKWKEFYNKWLKPMNSPSKGIIPYTHQIIEKQIRGQQMTVTELTQLQYLGSEINQIDIRIKEAKAEAEGRTSGGITGMPFGTGISDKVGNGASRISDLIKRLEKTKSECWDEINRLMTYIGSIKESEMRQIMSLRYINGFTFQKIAFATGGWDESVPRKKHNKYLELSELSETKGGIV